MKTGFLPQGENLRKAIRWLSEQQDHSARTVQEAARRFDLSPADEEFLLRHFAGTDPQVSKND